MIGYQVGPPQQSGVYLLENILRLLRVREARWTYPFVDSILQEEIVNVKDLKKEDRPTD